MNVNKLAKKLWKTLLLILIFFCSKPVFAQEEVPDSLATRKSAIRLFLDCDDCDMDYLREKMPYVNFVRDVKESQLYVLVTSNSTGSGGTEFTLFFAGQEHFAGMKDTIVFNSRPDDTDDLIRMGLTNTMALGLMRYVAQTPIKNSIEVKYNGERQDDPDQVDDKWNFWVFEIETEPTFSFEESEREITWTNIVTADRVTEAWNIQNTMYYSYYKDTYIKETEDELTGVVTETKTEAKKLTWYLSNFTAKSLTDHWSLGLSSGIRSSTYYNWDLRTNLGAAIEYNIFPYSQSNQRQLRMYYGLYHLYCDYIDTTIYNKTKEHLFQQRFDVALEIQQKWGSADLSLEALSYLHDIEKYRIELESELSIRIFKGFSVTLEANVAFIQNQVGLVKESISNEALYLGLRERETGYQYEGGIGLSYTFGSMFNNVVNPRFGY